MIQIVSQRLAEAIKSAVPDHPASIEVLKYSISFIVQTLSVIFLCLVISLFTGRWLETIVVLIGFALLRQLSGGFHLKSSVLCIAVSTAVIAFIAAVELSLPVQMALNAASALLVLWFAPADIERQTRIPRRYYPYLKIASLLLIGLSFLVIYSPLTAAFFVQALTIVKVRR